MVSYYGYTPSPGQSYDRELQKRIRRDPGYCTPAYTRGNAFKSCPVCGLMSLRKNISGRLYCGNCKRFIEVED